MESSIEIIYNVIKTEYEKNRNIKPIEEIITNEYINGLLDAYDNNKVIYCLKTLQNIGIDFEILDEDIEYNAEEEENVVEEENMEANNVVEEKKENNLKTSIARDDNEYRELVKQRFGKCIICQKKECHISCCQVAHIYDFSKCVKNNDEVSKYDVNNGLLMCANTHLMFDKHLLKLKIIDVNNAMVSIEIDKTLKDCNIYRYNGQIIIIFKENMKYLEKRYSNTGNIVENTI
jgi:predicted restriction endonuclease